MAKVMDDSINTQSAAYILARIETKLDITIANHEAHKAEDSIKFKEADTRIDKLEQYRSWLFGAAAVIGGAVTMFGDKVLAKVFH